jgi:hypothetical protein
MSTPSTLLLCAGAAAGLAAVWTLAGLSERSALRSTPRVMAAAAVGLLGEVVVYGRAAPQWRTELALPLLFGIASVLALTVGAAKVEAALADRDGPRVVRRAAGIVFGSFCAMAAVGVVSLDLASASVSHARLGWALMFALVASTLVVFIRRARYAGLGLLALGPRGLLLGVLVAALLVGARLKAASAPSAEAVRAPFVEPPATATAKMAPPPVAEAPALPAPLASAVGMPSPSASAVSASAAPSAAPAALTPGTLLVDSVTARGLLEADVRGGVARRMDKLQACLTDPNNLQTGTLSLKVGIDASGSVTYSRALGGELAGTPLGSCLLPVFYKMGFAAPPSSSAYFEITLRAP